MAAPSHITKIDGISTAVEVEANYFLEDTAVYVRRRYSGSDLPFHSLCRLNFSIDVFIAFFTPFSGQVELGEAASGRDIPIASCAGGWDS